MPINIEFSAISTGRKPPCQRRGQPCALVLEPEHRIPEQCKEAQILPSTHGRGPARRAALDDAIEAGKQGLYLTRIGTFLVSSWLERLRQHQRVTNADRIVQDTIREFNVSG